MSKNSVIKLITILVMCFALSSCSLLKKIPFFSKKDAPVEKVEQIVAEETGDTGDTDTDGDGVKDALDKCPNTVKGVEVDLNGCPPDSDGDGVYDGVDECQNTPRGADVDSQGCWIVKVYFDLNKYKIKSQYSVILDRAVSVLKKNKSLKIAVYGHADNLGAEAYNEKLSLNRAKAIKNYLVKKGLDKGLIEIKGFGFSKPAVPNTTDENRSLNRRVEISIR